MISFFRAAIRSASMLLLIAGLISPAHAGEEGFVDEISPPVLERGKTTRVIVRGRGLEQPIGLWSSLPGKAIEAKPVAGGDGTSAEFDVQLPAEAPLGLYGLRVVTNSGLSNVHLFVVDEIPVTNREAAPAEAAPVKATLPACITSRCRPSTADRYAITVKAAEAVTFEVIGNRLGKDYDPLITIRDANGKMLCEHDNDPGLFFDFRFQYEFAEAGTYIVELRDARFEGHDTWHYVLRMGAFPAARVAVPTAVRRGHTTPLWLAQPIPQAVYFHLPATAPEGAFLAEVRRPGAKLGTWIPLVALDEPGTLELEPNHSREQATPSVVPGSLNGVLSKPGERDWFSFWLQKQQKIAIQAEARNLGSAADLELALFDSTGREVRRIDDVGLEEGSFTFDAGQEGVYSLSVVDVARGGSPSHVYRIDVRDGGPRLQLAAEVAALTVPQGSYQALPVTITRTNFQGPVELSLVGAPPGLTLENAVAPAESNEVVCRLRADPALPVGICTLQVVGRAKSGDVELQATARTQPLIDRLIRNVDLILYGLREDQRRLPPSLADRVACQITPPAPFEMNLPDAALLLTRYQQADLRVETSRAPGFTAPISLSAQGGQIGDEAQERHQVFVRFPQATSDALNVTGTFHTRILTNLAKHRVDVFGTVLHDGHRVTLNRAFQLEIQTAFSPSTEPAKVMVAPGETAKFRLLANRVSTFDGAVIVTPNRVNGLSLPESWTIPAGAPHLDIEIPVAANAAPNRYQIQTPSTGFVGKYEEGLNGKSFEIEVMKPKVEEKK